MIECKHGLATDKNILKSKSRENGEFMVLRLLQDGKTYDQMVNHGNIYG